MSCVQDFARLQSLTLPLQCLRIQECGYSGDLVTKVRPDIVDE